MRPRFGSAIASVGRWRDLFNACFEVLLYDLTSTYLEANPPFPEEDKRRFGYSRDRRSDCVQVVIALIVTPEGLPLAYEVLPFRGPVAPNQSLNPLHPRIGQVGLAPHCNAIAQATRVTSQLRAESPFVSSLSWAERGTVAPSPALAN